MRRPNWQASVILAAFISAPLLGAEDPCLLHSEYIAVSAAGHAAVTEVEIQNQSQHPRLWLEVVWPDLGPDRSATSLRLAWNYGLCVSSKGKGGPTPHKVGPLSVGITNIYLVAKDPDCKAGQVQTATELIERPAPQKPILKVTLKDR